MNATTEPSSVFATLVERSLARYHVPSATATIIQQLNDDRYEEVQLLEAVNQDPGLAERIVKLANSPVVELSRPVSTTEQALRQLGVRPFCWLALSAGLPPELLEGISPEILDRFWRHAVAKALAAYELTRRFNEDEPAQAFACGIIQHLGVLTLIQHLGQPYIEFLEQVWQDQGDLSPLEVASMGFDHRGVSACLAREWGLPDSFVDVITHPWHPAELQKLGEESRGLAKRMHLAEQFARVVHDRDDLSLYRLADIGRRFYEMTQSQLAELLIGLDDRLEGLSQVYEFSWNVERRFDKMLQDPRRPLDRAFADSAGHRSQVGSQALDQIDEVEPLLESAQQSELSDQDSSRQSGDHTDDASAANEGKPRRANPITPHNKLLALLKHVVHRCRHKRCPLALGLVEIDDFAELMTTADEQEIENLILELDELQTLHRTAGDLIWRVAPARWAIVFQDHDRGEAVQQCRDRMSAISSWSRARVDRGEIPASVSFGVAGLALPPKNFDPEELVKRAAGCLSGAQLSGGDTLKSIGV